MNYTGINYDNIEEQANDENIEELICRQFRFLKNQLPKNSLDVLISELGGEPEVAELTGRVHGQRFCQADPNLTLKVTRDITKKGINLSRK